MTSRPVFRGTSLDSPVTKVGLPLIAVEPEVAGHLPGTACLVAPWFAMTARHVVEELAFPQDGAGHLVFTQVVTNQGRTVLPLFVYRVFYAQPYDIALRGVGGRSFEWRGGRVGAWAHGRLLPVDQQGWSLVVPRLINATSA